MPAFCIEKLALEKLNVLEAILN